MARSVTVGGHDLVEPVLGDVEHIAAAQMEHDGAACSREERVCAEVWVSCVHVATFSAGVINLGIRVNGELGGGWPGVEERHTWLGYRNFLFQGGKR